MANGPIGISFLPSQDNQQQGMQRGQMEGDLGEAMKILSLRMPRVVGPGAISPLAGLSSDQAGSGSLSPFAPRTAGGESGGFNPNAALFQALVSAMLGGGGGGLSGSGGSTFTKQPTDNSGTTKPYIKYITDGEVTPGKYDPITTESGDSGLNKPEQRTWGDISRGTTLDMINGDVSGYGRIPRKYDPTMTYTSLP